jgi:hypothetical protein
LKRTISADISKFHQFFFQAGGVKGLMSELVNATIKFGMAPLEVGHEFDANF